MKKFIFNIIMFLIPIIAYALIIFSLYDQVIRKPYIQRNRSEHLIEILQKNETLTYNTFILGNSRSQMLKAYNFNKCSEDNSLAFHFDNPGGNIYHFYNSLNYLISKYSVKRVILFIDGQSINFKVDDNNYATNLSPEINSKYLDYYFSFIKGFFDYKMIASILYKEFEMSPLDFFRGYVLDEKSYNSTDLITGDIEFEVDRLIKRDRINFYESGEFDYLFENKYQADKLKMNTSKQYLHKIKSIFDIHNINYSIVIPPVYLNESTSKDQVELIKKIFNPTSVLDFSASPNIYNDKYFFKDYSHFNEQFGEIIFSKIEF